METAHRRRLIAAFQTERFGAAEIVARLDALAGPDPEASARVRAIGGALRAASPERRDEALRVAAATTDWATFLSSKGAHTPLRALAAYGPSRGDGLVELQLEDLAAVARALSLQPEEMPQLAWWVLFGDTEARRALEPGVRARRAGSAIISPEPYRHRVYDLLVTGMDVFEQLFWLTQHVGCAGLLPAGAAALAEQLAQEAVRFTAARHRHGHHARALDARPLLQLLELADRALFEQLVPDILADPWLEPGAHRAVALDAVRWDDQWEVHDGKRRVLVRRSGRLVLVWRRRYTAFLDDGTPDPGRAHARLHATEERATRAVNEQLSKAVQQTGCPARPAWSTQARFAPRLLEEALVLADFVTIEDLLRSGVPPGFGALHRAAWSGDPDVVQLLLDAGADPNELDDADSSPLMWALDAEPSWGRSDAAALLARAGGTRGCRDGHRALHQAAAEGYADVARALIDAGADAMEPVERGELAGKTAAEVAESRGRAGAAIELGR